VSFTKLPPLESFQHCNVCPPKPQTMPLEAPVHPGFGDVTVQAEDEPAWEQQHPDEDATLRSVEDYVLERGEEHDWRLTIYGPMYEAEYQRQGKGEWVLVRRGEGFA
jgi:hypothetical protein